MFWVIIALLAAIGALALIGPRLSGEDLVQDEEPIDIAKGEAPPPLPVSEPKEVFYRLNTHSIKRSLLPLNVFNANSAELYKEIMIKQAWSTDKFFHDLIACFILFCENENLYVVPSGARVTHSINRGTNEKYKMCKAVPLLLAVKRCVISIANDKKLSRSKRKELIISTFIMLFKRAEHLSYGVVEADEALEEILRRCDYEISLDDWTNLVNHDYIEDKIFYSRTCNCIFQLNRKMYQPSIPKLPAKEMISIDEYNF